AGRGLAAAHAVGLLHNDVKPWNVLVSEQGQVKLTDFGLASSMPRGDKDQDKPIGGTPLYMAPEFDREAASDQFSLCASLYQALYGVPPYVGKNHLHLMLLMEQGDPQIGVSLPDIPERVRAAVHKGIAANPAARHESVTALVVELEQCLAEGSETETARAESSQGNEPGRKHSGWMSVALMLMFLGPMLGMVATLGMQRVGIGAGSLQIEEIVRRQLSVPALTRMALLAAERGDGDNALSLLEDARDQARTTEEVCFVAEKADDVGMRLYDARRWQDAIDAHDFAATIHQQYGQYRAYVRSTHLSYVALQAKIDDKTTY
ncbi:MAG: protein kinase, partial [Myxococcales bacterium]|nr:protein kinase [Myxococcales bacterium]